MLRILYDDFDQKVKNIQDRMDYTITPFLYKKGVDKMNKIIAFVCFVCF